MAKAFLPSIDSVTGNGDGTFTIYAIVGFSGSDVVGGTDISPITPIISGSDSPIDIKNKLVDAILAEAAKFGYSLVATDIILPDFQKGN